MRGEHPESGAAVTIEDFGRCAYIHYREGENYLRFDSELLTGDAVAGFWIAVDQWDALHPWAAGRLREILEAVGQEVVRQRAPNCSADVDEKTGWVIIRQAASR